jgi:hypothetical protein
MTDLYEFRERLEEASNQIESAGWEAGQAESSAQDAASNADRASSIISDLIDSVDAIIGFDKEKVEKALRHISFLSKVQTMYVNHLDNLVSNNDVESRENISRYNAMISMIQHVTIELNGQLKWDEGFKFDTEYADGAYQYKTVAVKEEV